MIVLAASPGSPLWYAARSAGVVSLTLLTASLVLGMATSARLQLASGSRFVLQGLHRSISLLVLLFLFLHVATALLDPFAGLALWDVLVPFASAYRPLWLGLGVVAAELFVALMATSLLRPRIRLHWWRLVHWTSYACWPAALLHGIGTGSDSRSGWFFALNALCVLGTDDPGWAAPQYDAMISQLKSVPASAFEAVDESSLMVSVSSDQARQPAGAPVPAPAPKPTPRPTATAVASQPAAKPLRKGPGCSPLWAPTR